MAIPEPDWLIAQTCEAILLSSSMQDEAYRRYALEANQATTHLATFRAIAKKYPYKVPEDILRDLVASTPGDEGKLTSQLRNLHLLYESAQYKRQFRIGKLLPCLKNRINPSSNVSFS